MKSFLLALSLLFAGPSTTWATSPEAPVGRLPQSVTPQHYRLLLDINPRKVGFTGRTDIDVELHEPTASFWLDGHGLHVDSVSVEVAGKRAPARYQEVDHQNGVARVTLSTTLPAGPATIHFQYSANLQTSASGLYRTRAGADWYAFSQMESIDARRVFPGFDEPGFKAPFDITIVTHGTDLAVTNTPEVRSTAVGAGAVRHEYLTTKPLPTYLLAFAVGPLDIAAAASIPPNAIRGEPLPLRIIGTRGQAAKFAFALKETPEIVRRLEEYMGIAFPYPKLDLIASPHHIGAMENAGAIIFADEYLALGDTPTPRQQSSFGDVAAHEIAHQWFGDLVTPAWWDDIWLNEAFAEWMGSKVADQWRPALGIAEEQLEGTLSAMDTDALRAGRPIRELVTNNRQIASTFDVITYEKGAGVIAMIESYLGPERFQQGVRLHLTRHAYASATSDEFFSSMAEGSHDPAVINAFRSFVDQPGLPLVTARVASDGSLQLEQTRYRLLGPNPSADEQWAIPFCASLYTTSQTAKRCTLLQDAHGSLSLPAAEQPKVIFPNADGAGYYRFAVDSAMLQALLTRVPAMSAREALVLADSVAAGFEAGRLSFTDFYTAARVLADHPDRVAARSLGFKLTDYATRLANAGDRPLLEQAMANLYEPRLRALGFDPTPGRYAAEPAERQLMRREMLYLVGLAGRDPQIRRELAAHAATSVSDPTSIEPLLRRTVWAIGLQEQGESLIGPLTALLRETRDPALREDAAFAVGFSDSPALVDAVHALVLDPRVESRMAFRILALQMQNPRTRASAWGWFLSNETATMERIPQEQRGSLVGYLAESFCSVSERNAFEEQLGANLRRENGGELAAARTLEQIDDCIALRERTGPAIQLTLATAR